jgi:long-chain acyl-CoA synthetase
MGGQQSVEYARFIPGTNKTPGFSDELVNINCKDENDLVRYPYDDVKTVWDAFQRSVKKFPNNDFLGTRNDKKEGRPYEWKTWKQVDEIVLNLSKGYQALNLCPEVNAEGKTWKFMGIYAKNREEWVMTDFACMANKGTSVAFYDTLGPETVEFVITQTGLTSISCSSNYIKGLCDRKKGGKAVSLANIISFEEVTEEHRSLAKDAGLNLYTFKEVQETGAKYSDYIKTPPVEDDIYMFCYTSGTTGTPKAAMLTHGNLVATATSTRSVITFDETDSMISYLPLAHSFEKCLFTCACIRGIKVGYYSGDPLKLMDDLQALKPTLFPSVPRLFNRIYDVINQKIRESPGYKQMLVTRAVNSKIYYLENGATYHHYTYDKIVMNTMKQMIGGNVRVMVTGSAPISGDVLKFLKVCFCAPILEGYGQTENSAAATLTKVDDPLVGHVGGPLEGLKIKLRDIPEMNYLHTDPEPRGEICFKGPAVF